MAANAPKSTGPSPVREAILMAGLDLIQTHGLQAVTTRAVAAAAAVQVPTIYRLFGGKEGLLSAMVERGVADYVATKAVDAATPDPDPVADLRRSWKMHVAFGLAKPALFAHMSNNPQSPAAAKGVALFTAQVRAVAQVGRLKTSEARALAMLRACCVGLVLTAVADHTPHVEDLSDEIMDAVLRSIINDGVNDVPRTPRAAAAMLRANLEGISSFTVGEKAILDEWLVRLSQSDA